MIRIFILFKIVLFLCNTSIGFSQHPKIDSLQAVLSHVENEQEVEVLHALILELWFEYPDKAKKYAKRAISISTSLDNIRLQSISLRLMGGVQIYQGVYGFVPDFCQVLIEN